MIEGESGILAISPPWNMPEYTSSLRKLTWPNGAFALTFSGENPEQLRGPQHEKAWVDELAKLKYPQETWDNLELGLRLGNNPQVVVTTTPKPVKIIRELYKDSQTYITSGSSYENAGNLAQAFIDRIIKKYEGTRLGRQELHAELLEDVKGALWNSKQIEDLRVSIIPEMKRVVVGVDPAVTNTSSSDEAGIVVAGLGIDDHGYVLDDASLRDSPDKWARAAVAAYHKLKADRIIGEANNGGDLVEIVIRTVDKSVSYKKVHASRGKLTRAEPVAALYEQKKVHHVGLFPLLEDEMTSWVPGNPSPNRMDALVWALTELMLDGTPEPRIRSF
jgi:phage terminase large subunit-like protein